MDFYLKGGDRDYALANLQNLHPVFSQEQLATSLCAMHLHEISRDAASLADSHFPVIDTATLVEDIKASLLEDPLAKREFSHCIKGSPSPQFTLSHSGLLLMDHHIYIPDFRPKCRNLRTHVLQEKHDHFTASHFGYNKTLELL